MEAADSEADVLVCSRADEPNSNPAGFDDQKFGTCGECGCRVSFRPYHKPELRKVCLQCFKPEPGQELVVTERTLEEVVRFFASAADKN